MPDDENYFLWIADVFERACRLMLVGFCLFSVLGIVYALGREDGSPQVVIDV